MILGNRLSAFPKTAPFLYPDNLRPRITRKSTDTTAYGQCLDANPTDWEMGGVALNDSSLGLQYQAWEFRLEGTSVVVQPLDKSRPEHVIFPGVSGITEVAGAFDSNMQYVVAYVQNSVTKLYWYNATVPGFVVTTFPGCDSPRLTLDDKRLLQNDSRDVLFFYLRADQLCYRQQRDKYAVETILRDCPPLTLRLGRVGMNSVNRVQIEFLCSG